MSSEISSERCKDWGATGLGGVFSVEWICKESLPFQVTHQLLNPWNDNKKVQISRDGQVGPVQDGGGVGGVCQLIISSNCSAFFTTDL